MHQRRASHPAHSEQNSTPAGESPTPGCVWCRGWVRWEEGWSERPAKESDGARVESAWGESGARRREGEEENEWIVGQKRRQRKGAALSAVMALILTTTVSTSHN
eukprot:3215831-Rhodomonas_salina.3